MSAGSREFGEVGQHPESDAAPSGRPYLSLYYRCANAYTRVYRAPTADHYLARCPTCGKTTRFQVGPGGVEQRVFEISCRG